MQKYSNVMSFGMFGALQHRVMANTQSFKAVEPHTKSKRKLCHASGLSLTTVPSGLSSVYDNNPRVVLSSLLFSSFSSIIQGSALISLLLMVHLRHLPKDGR